MKENLVKNFELRFHKIIYQNFFFNLISCVSESDCIQIQIPQCSELMVFALNYN